MNKSVLRINLQFFGDFGKDFFTNAFEEAYNITEGEVEDTEVPSDAPESTESDSNTENEELPANIEEAPQKPSKEEIEKLYKEYFGEQETPKVAEPEFDEETKSAIELYKYLEENPHLVQAMRDVDVKGYEKLNTYVPDELTKKVQELEEFIQEQKYNSYIKELKEQYKDFDEEKVLEYAESKEIYDLEVAYKALKSESIQEPNIEEIEKRIREQIMEELKQNSLNTQSIVGGISQKPVNTDSEVNLSSKEKRIALAMGMTPEEYAKWR